jgi:NADH-quinone oxidoreductase subunit N
MIFDAISWMDRAAILLVVSCLVLLAFAKSLEASPRAVTVIGLFGAAAAIACGVQEEGVVRFGVLVAGALVAVAILLLHTAELFDARQRPEVAALVLIGGVGAIMLANGRSLLELALGVEMISLSGTTLVALGRGRLPLEAGFKYFLLTAVTFATFLFGMALVFVATGSLALPTAASGAAGMAALVPVGVGLMVVGLAFKLAVVPVHFGALDAYTAGPSSFVGFIMMASKLGAAIALARLAVGMGASIQQLLMAIGLVTIGFGAVASFAQTDLRRLLAYSAVAHAGFLALAAGSGQDAGDTVRFYILGYGAAALLCFAALAGTGTSGFAITQLGSKSRGLGRPRSLMLLLGLLSLAGVPPLPGFWTKLAVLKASYEAWGGLATAIAALGGVIGVIYYLRPMPDLLAAVGNDEETGGGGTPVAAVLAALVIALGVVPALAWMLAR